MDADKEKTRDTGPPKLNPGDQGAPGTPGTGENVCPECGGIGWVGDGPCQACGGTGKVVEGIAGG
jgi:hypothetical protein